MRSSTFSDEARSSHFWKRSSKVVNRTDAWLSLSINWSTFSVMMVSLFSTVSRPLPRKNSSETGSSCACSTSKSKTIMAYALTSRSWSANSHLAAYLDSKARRPAT